MKSFLLKTLIFSSPLILLIAIEVGLPLSTFTFRPYEALLYRHGGLGYPFYPNHRLRMMSTGDLCFRGEYGVLKDELWVTDELGYRNNETADSADVIVIGDSFIYGTANTQDSIFSNLVHSLSSGRLKCYNIAPATFDEFILLTDGGYLHLPKVVIMSKVERDIPREIGFNAGRKMHRPYFTSVLADKAGRFYSLRSLHAELFRNARPSALQSRSDPRMLFLGNTDAQNVSKAVETIVGFRDYCSSIGVEFIYLPAPNKETIYFEEAGLAEQPSYIGILCRELSVRGVRCVNTVKLFNDHRSEHAEMLYHTDDSHWNARGISIAAEECIRQINALEDSAEVVRP